MRRHSQLQRVCYAGVFILVNKIVLFSIFIQDYWKDLDNQRNCFVEFAKNKRFDPLTASNWYNITTKTARTHKVCVLSSLLSPLLSPLLSSPLVFSYSFFFCIVKVNLFREYRLYYHIIMTVSRKHWKLFFLKLNWMRRPLDHLPWMNTTWKDIKQIVLKKPAHETCVWDRENAYLMSKSCFSCDIIPVVCL